MNAQQLWKASYRLFTQACYDSPEDIRWHRTDMKIFRREAALERHCEALQRRISELEGQLKEMEDREVLRDKLEWGTP